MSEHPDVLRPGEMEWIDRGAGVRSVPLVGKWNTESAELTTGITAFVPGTELPLHTHNVDETVLILEGEALVTIADERSQLGAQDVTWIPAGVPHAFANRGDGPLRIYWVYAGRNVTRTIVATGETFEHLSARDRSIAQ